MVDKDLERWLFFHMHRQQHKDIRNTKDQEAMTQQEKKNRNLQQETLKNEIYKLPDQKKQLKQNNHFK